MKYSITFIMMLLVIAGAVAYVQNEITAPPGAPYSTSTTTTVNISGMINISGFPYLQITGFNRSKYTGQNISKHTINVTILNCTITTSGTCTYGILAASLPLTINISNNTAGPVDFWNYSATLKNGELHSIRINWTNVSRNDAGAFGGSLSEERLIEIDTEANIFAFQFYNFSFITADGTKSYCGVDNSDVWSCTS